MRSRAKTVLVGLLLVCLLGSGLTALSCESDQIEETLSSEEFRYVKLWQEASTALVQFTLAELETSRTAEGSSLAKLANTYREKRDAFQAALTGLEGAESPSSLSEFHSQIIPLYREILEAMGLMIGAADQGDETELLIARAKLIDAMEKTVTLVQQSQL